MAFYPYVLTLFHCVSSAYLFTLIQYVRVVRTRGRITFCLYSFVSYALHVTNILLSAFHSDYPILIGGLPVFFRTLITEMFPNQRANILLLAPSLEATILIQLPLWNSTFASLLEVFKSDISLERLGEFLRKSSIFSITSLL